MYRLGLVMVQIVRESDGDGLAELMDLVGREVLVQENDVLCEVVALTFGIDQFRPVGPGRRR